jgi:hypothetical protein
MANCFFIFIFKYSVTSAYCNHGCNVINRLILQIFVRFHNSIWHLYTKANQTACLVNVIIQLLLSDTAWVKGITLSVAYCRTLIEVYLRHSNMFFFHS